MFIKENVSRNEFMINRLTNFLGIPSPKVLGYQSNTLKLEKINGMSLSDFYGEKETDIPEYIFESIRVIVEELLKIGICYPDITGYNFMIDDKEKLWIIDFGHAYVTNPEEKDDEFVTKFIEGHNGWNPLFK